MVSEGDLMLCYCNKCGRVVSLLKKELNEPCDYCRNITQPVPDKYLNDSKIFIKKELEQQFINECIKSSPEFDQYLFDHRDKDLFNRRMEDRAKLEHGKAVLEGRDKGNKFGIECPYCHATNVKKISTTSKVGGVALFGILGLDRAGKQWHCTYCNSDF
ncbi:MAG: hypothetical protein NC429_16560 [Lachnospiraceae bacterium]|nr:hypothetical protein [Lachnospiraceae bacterium]